MKSGFVVLLTVIISLLFVSQSFSQKRMHKKDEMRKEFISQLNLTEEQSDKFDELRSENHKAMIDLKAELEKKQVEMKDLQKSENLKRADLLAKVKEMNEIKNEKALLKANHQMNVYEILDDTQKELWREHHSKKMMGRKDKFNRKEIMKKRF